MRELTEEEEKKLSILKIIYLKEEEIVKKSFLGKMFCSVTDMKNKIGFALNSVEMFLTHDIKDLEKRWKMKPTANISNAKVGR